MRPFVIHLVIPCELANSIICCARFFCDFARALSSFKRKPRWPMRKKRGTQPTSTKCVYTHSHMSMCCSCWRCWQRWARLSSECTNEQSSTSDSRIYYAVDGVSTVFIFCCICRFFLSSSRKEKQQQQQHKHTQNHRWWSRIKREWETVCVRINQTSGSLLPLERRQHIFFSLFWIHSQTHFRLQSSEFRIQILSTKINTIVRPLFILSLCSMCVLLCDMESVYALCLEQ